MRFLGFLRFLESDAVSEEQCSFTPCCRRWEMLSLTEFGASFAYFLRSFHWFPRVSISWRFGISGGGAVHLLVYL